MASWTKPFGSPTVKPVHPASSEPIAQDQLNTATNFGEASTVFDPPVPVMGDVDILSPPRPHVPVTRLPEHLQRGRSPTVPPISLLDNY